MPPSDGRTKPTPRVSFIALVQALVQIQWKNRMDAHQLAEGRAQAKALGRALRQIAPHMTKRQRQTALSTYATFKRRRR